MVITQYHVGITRVFLAKQNVILLPKSFLHLAANENLMGVHYIHFQANYQQLAVSRK